MQEITFPSGKKGWIEIVTGVVSGHQKWSQTNVSSSGSGWFINSRYGGVINLPTVSSVSVEKQEFWINTPDGKAQKFTEGVDVSNGHMCTVLRGGLDNEGGQNFILENATSNMNWLLGASGTFYAKKFMFDNEDKKIISKMRWRVFIIATVAASALIFISSGDKRENISIDDKAIEKANQVSDFKNAMMNQNLYGCQLNYINSYVRPYLCTKSMNGGDGAVLTDPTERRIVKNKLKSVKKAIVYRNALLNKYSEELKDQQRSSAVAVSIFFGSIIGGILAFILNGTRNKIFAKRKEEFRSKLLQTIGQI